METSRVTATGLSKRAQRLVLIALLVLAIAVFGTVGAESGLRSIISVSAPTDSASATLAAVSNGAIHASGDNGSADFYASGNDDSFSEYALGSFIFTSTDFGVTDQNEIASVDAVTLTLTHNDRSFTDGDMVEFFLTLDAFGGDYSGLTYSSTLTNGLDIAQYTYTPVSLGVYPYTPQAGGVMETFNLNMSAAMADFVDALNNEAEFNIIMAATDATHDITFSGVGNTFDPGDPTLQIDVTTAPKSVAANGSRVLDFQGAIHDSGDNGSADYYGSGNDDGFGEYGIASFIFSNTDFGLSGAFEIASIDTVSYTLTHNDRSFSDGDMVEFFLTTDAYAGDYTGLIYDQSLYNGLDASNYTFAPVSVGVFPYTPQDGGVLDTFNLDFSDVMTDVVAAINAGGEFSIIISTTAGDHDITYSGKDNSFDPGDPLLEMDVTAIQVADVTAPILEALSPADDSIGVAVDSHLEMHFNEAVQAGSGDIEVRHAADDSLFASIPVSGTAVTANVNVISIDPGMNMDTATEYYVIVPVGAIEDASGNDFAGITSVGDWSFTTIEPAVSNFGPFDVSTNALAGTVVGDLNPNLNDASGVEFALIAGNGAQSMMEGLGDYSVMPIHTVGDTITGTTGALNANSAGDYSPPGILDGIGALELDSNTVRVFANHELVSGVGYSYTLANGSSLTGARISYFDIDKTSRAIVDAGIAFDTVINKDGVEVTDANKADMSGGISRLCSAQMVPAGTYGFIDDIFFSGEEDSGANGGLGGLEYALDVDNGTFYAVPVMGYAAWENVTAVDSGDPDKVALLIGDDRAGAPLYLYVGNKGLDADGDPATDFMARNGLANGSVYYWKADSGDTEPADFNGTGSSRTGTWVAMTDLSSITNQDAEVAAGGGFTFSRPEDVATDPDNGTRVVMSSTGNGAFPADVWGTTYIIDLGFSSGVPMTATVDIIFDGDEAANQDAGIRSPDNLDWADDGYIYIQEDRSIGGFGATSGEETSIWRISPDTGDILRVAQMNRDAVLTLGSSDSAPSNLGNWESSGILDVSTLFGEDEGTLFIFDVQAHSIRDGLISDLGLVEGGQLSFMMRDTATGAFDINPNTGVITVADPAAIDAAGVDSFTLRVQAFDGSNYTFVDVVINVNDDAIAAPTDLKVATYNASLNRGAAGDLVEHLSTSNDSQAHQVAELIQRVNPDVLLVNEFDYDADGAALMGFMDNYLEVAHGDADPIYFGYYYNAPSNTGVASGFDLDNSGSVGGGNDAFGFGNFEGQYAFIVLSKYPIDHDMVRSFQYFLWKDMPGAMLPADPNDADGNGDLDNWFTSEELDVVRLSSKNHVDVPVHVNGHVIHILAAHPTPPVFDGDEDRNGTRNFDEIRFWADYVDPSKSSYIYDDAEFMAAGNTTPMTPTGGLEDGAQFVIVGDYNSDPFDGDSVAGAANQFTDNPLMNNTVIPSSLGGPEDATNDGGINDTHTGNPAYDTSDFGDPPGNLRVDYALPSANLDITGAGVFWPVLSDPLSDLVGASDHRPVYVSVDVTIVEYFYYLPTIFTAPASE